MPKFIGNLQPPTPKDTGDADDWSIPVSQPASSRGVTTLEVPDAGSPTLSSFVARKQPPSKESAGSFINRAVSSKDTSGSAKKARLSSAEESVVSNAGGGMDKGGDRLAGNGGGGGGGGGGSRSPAASRRGTNTSSRSRNISRSPSQNRIHSPGSTGGGSSRRPSSESGSRSRRRSTGDGSEASDESEGLEDLDTVPESLWHNVPLHLLEAEILKAQPSSVTNQTQKERASPLSLAGRFSRHHASSRLGQARNSWKEEYVVEAPPEAEVQCGKLWFWIQVYVFIIWVFLAASLLLTHVIRFKGEVGDTSHRMAADMALQRLEVNTSGIFAPAVSVARGVALGARAGIFEAGDCYEALRSILGPDMGLSPSIRRVQILGVEPERMAIVLPGRLHDTTAVHSDREPVMYTIPTTSCFDADDPMACFGLNTSGLAFASAPTEGADIAWLGPSYLDVGQQGELLPVEDWDLAHHLVAFVNMTMTGTAGALPRANLFVDVAIELSAVASAAWHAVPENGALALLTKTGWALATSLPPEPPVFYITEDFVPVRPYNTLWDLGPAWITALTPQAVGSPEYYETWAGDDLVVVRPFSMGMRGEGVKAASTASLRLATFVPRPTAVRPLLVQLNYAAIAVLAAPFATAVWLAICYCLLRSCRFCKAKCY